MLNKILKNNIFLTFFVWIIVFWIVYYLSVFWVNIDKNLSDKIYRNYITEKVKTSNNIKVIWIDELTVNNLWRFPFNRNEYIKIIEKLNTAEASVIWFDIIFADKTKFKIDDAFAKKVKESWNIFLWWWVIKSHWKNNSIIENIEKPYEKLLESWKWLWYFSVIPDKDNNKVYWINPIKHFTNWDIYNHFSIWLLKEYYSQLYGKDYNNFRKESDKYFYLTPNIKIPFHNKEKNEILINYSKINKSISFYNILNQNDEINKKIFKNKIVIIWATGKAMNDNFNTPNGEIAGVFTHANMINTILTKQYKEYFNKNLEYSLIFFLILLSVYLNISQWWKKLLISNIAIIWIVFIIMFLVITIWLESALNYPAQFIFALIITLTVSNILKSFMEDKNKTRLNKALSQYVSKDIAEEILHWEWKINLDWERKTISIFFSDIEWFTTISEKMNPEELVIFLREYLWAMSNIIMDQKWLIDKYEWDAIMALWWVFWNEKDSTYNNCISAINQQKKLNILNKDWKKRFWEELKIRMWINTWEAIVWNIWAEGRKMEYTALWDSVNLASRLEEVNKKYWTYLCTSEIVYIEQKENFDFRYLDQIKVKWKNIPVKIYELISIKWEISDLKKSIVEKFEKSIELYLSKNFEKALEEFKELSLLWDNPSKTYISRCEEYIKNPPEKNWDWVWTMMSK